MYSSILKSTMIQNNAVIKNNAGIHVRPSGVIISEIGNYNGKIVLTMNKISIELNSVMSLLTLGMMKDDKVEITVTGQNEEKTCTKVKELMERIYDFPPRH